MVGCVSARKRWQSPRGSNRPSRRDARRIRFLAVFDAALRATLNIVDMPNRRAALLVRLILQNKEKLSKGKRASFAEITDLEVERIETAVWGIWQKSQQEMPAEDS